jgi:hypothetical protein
MDELSYLSYTVLRKKTILIRDKIITIDVINSNVDEVIKTINQLDSEKTCVFNPPTDVIKSVSSEYEGIYFSNGVLPHKEESVSRFAMAWWSDVLNDIKHLKIFGDRICCHIDYVATPSLFPFGLDPFHVVYPSKRPYECNSCKCSIDFLTSNWNEGEFFLCNNCQYESDSGFKSGFERLNKNK